MVELLQSLGLVALVDFLAVSQPCGMCRSELGFDVGLHD
jgi:hypothetical protein